MTSDGDFAFHLAVALASENPFYVNTLSSLKDQVLFGMNLARSFSGRQDREAATTVMQQHTDIVEAILYLENANFVTGEILHVDGGQIAGH